MSETLRADEKEQATQTRVMLCALYFSQKVTRRSREQPAGNSSSSSTTKSNNPSLALKFDSSFVRPSIINARRTNFSIYSRAVAGVRKGFRNQDECKSLSSRRRAGGNCKRLGQAAHTGKLHSNLTPGSRARTVAKICCVWEYLMRNCVSAHHTELMLAMVVGGNSAAGGSALKTAAAIFASATL
jgi:hypothetical protein